MCGAGFSKSWSDGGVGAVCEQCFQKRQDLDLLRSGLIRNIKPVVDMVELEERKTYTFEALIDGKWYLCHSPCGDWSYVKDESLALFSVPVGFWELQELYERHTTFRYYRHNKSYRKLLRHERIEEGAMQSWCHGELQPIVNADGETVGGTPADFSEERDFYNPI
jgi:hypothetical protein